MSSELTPVVGLFKAVPGTGEPFRTTDLNGNSDLLDAAIGDLQLASSDYGSRLDAVEADNWVTSDRIAPNAVGNGELGFESVDSGNIRPRAVQGENIALNGVSTTELAGELDFGLSGNIVKVATQSVGDSSTLAASTAFVGAAIAAKGLPTKIKAGTTSAVSSGGQVTVSFSGLGFTASPHVTATAVGAGAHYVVSIITKSSSGATFYVTTISGATVPTGNSVTLSWVAVQS